MRILIAEDHAVTRQMLETLLKRWGYDVISVEDGTQAWQVLQEDNPVRLILLDWIMPGMDGVQLCRKIRTSNLAKYTYIILLTSKDLRDDVVDGLQAGADDYVTKPFDKEELRMRITAGRRIVELVEEQKKALQSQIDLRNRIDQLLVSIPSGLIIVDAETHKIVDANSMAILMFGAPLEQIVGLDCHVLFGLEDKSNCVVGGLGNSVDKREGELINARGEKLSIQKSTVAVDIQGKSYYIQNFFDISEHKLAEKERIQKEKFDSVLELAGAVCHELNQPLQVLSGHTALMLSGTDKNDPLCQRAETMKGQIDRMAQTTLKLMNITRYKTKDYQEEKIFDIEQS